jgi:hypothetical protein
MHPTLVSSLVSNFTVVSIGNENDIVTNSTIRRLFSQNCTSNFNVSSLVFNPVSYSITLQARIFSTFGGGISATITKTLVF